MMLNGFFLVCLQTLALDLMRSGSLRKFRHLRDHTLGGAVLLQGVSR